MAGRATLGGRSPVIALLAAAVCACQSVAMDQPARLASTSDANLSALRTALGEAVGRAQVTLGPEDLRTSSAISVLPPPLGPRETHSMARPTPFDLILEAATGACLVINRETGERHTLPGVACQPAVSD